MISGVRADVAVKLFGDDFDTLVDQGPRAGAGAAATCPAAPTWPTEQITGQPMLQVKVDQDQIARYGVPAAGGAGPGRIARRQAAGRSGRRAAALSAGGPPAREHCATTPRRSADPAARRPRGERIPLSRAGRRATWSTGRKMISREWSKRRITVQCNVRGRDVGSFVAEAQQKIAARGRAARRAIRIEWGGQFENMQRAQQRLTIVVPLALALIVGLLYLTYRNVIDTLLRLHQRAVRLRRRRRWRCGCATCRSRSRRRSASSRSRACRCSTAWCWSRALRDLLQRGPAAARGRSSRRPLTRLRTVLMTALVASLGFVPMALSTGIGAEVQRPLATVVIGGVISSTLMTLIALPVFYSILGRFATSKQRPDDRRGADQLIFPRVRQILCATAGLSSSVRPFEWDDERQARFGTN